MNAKNQDILFVIVMGIILILVGAIASNAMPPRENYTENQCELIAKDFQREYGGSLVFIQPLKQNGAYDLGVFSGHFVNHAHGNYTDYGQNMTFNSTSEVLSWYTNVTGKKAELFDLGREHTPFSIYWGYP